MKELTRPILNCPNPSIVGQNKLNENTYYLSLDNQKYELVISLYDGLNYNDKIFNFKLMNIQQNNKNYIYYEKNKYTSQLIQLFSIKVQNVNDPTLDIFTIIENCHSNKNASISKKNNSEDILDLIYTLQIIDNEKLSLTIELNKTVIDEKDKIILLEEIRYLRNTLKKLDKKYNELNESLLKKINYLNNNINKNKQKKKRMKNFNYHLIQKYQL